MVQNEQRNLIVNDSLYFEWLTYNWLQDNIFILGSIMLLGIFILFLFPLLLGFDMKKEIRKKNKNDELKG